MNYDDMTVDELERLNTELSNERAKIKQQQREINRILDVKRAEQIFGQGQTVQVNVARIRTKGE